MLQERLNVANASLNANRNLAGIKRLPVQNSQLLQSKLKPDLSVPRAPLALRNVLVVDDSPGVCAALARALNRPSLRVFTASTTHEAFQLLERELFDLVIAELRLSPITGIEFLECVRRDYPAIKRVLITGECDVNVVREAINRSGICFFLGKPWDAHSLRELVRSLLQTEALEFRNEFEPASSDLEKAPRAETPKGIDSADRGETSRGELSELAEGVGEVLKAGGAFECKLNQCGQMYSERVGQSGPLELNVSSSERSQRG